MSPVPPSTQVIGLVGWLLLSFITAAAGAIASVQAAAFYQQLALPAWAPPAAVFGPVWSVLYILIGVAAWLVWRKHAFLRARIALTLFALQLVANALWSWLFFAWHLGGLAFADISLLWVLVAGTVAAFFRLSRFAAALLLPYLAWISFAALLNFSVWQLNPALLG